MAIKNVNLYKYCVANNPLPLPPCPQELAASTAGSPSPPVQLYPLCLLLPLWNQHPWNPLLRHKWQQNLPRMTMLVVIQHQELPLQRPQPVLSSVARMRTENSFIESDIRVLRRMVGRSRVCTCPPHRGPKSKARRRAAARRCRSDVRRDARGRVVDGDRLCAAGVGRTLQGPRA